MLCCLLNNQRINCFDGVYSKEQLKKWASKKILLCPACGRPYEYCHGKIKSPYFRHMDKEQCEDQFSEVETEEHMQGKRDLYEWLKVQTEVTDVILEGWIPETKQRPDIMFKYNGEQYVLEYQCSPISSEYYERHELYEAAGIKDIWILGTEKYFNKSSRKKHIQTVAMGHYSPIDKNLIIYKYTDFYNHLKNTNNTLNMTLYTNANSERFYGRNIVNYRFYNNQIIDQTFKTLEEIDVIRNSRKLKSSCEARNKNTYLHLQQDINAQKQLYFENCMRQRLSELSNDNWKFYLTYTKSKYKHFDYICAYPVIKKHEINNYKDLKDLDFLQNKRFEKIALWKFNSDEKLQCYTDVNYLKNMLIPIMKRNKEILLQHTFQDIRILERA